MRVLLIVAMVFMSNAVLASTVNSTKIIKVTAGTTFGNNVFVAVETGPSSPPSCQTNGTYSYAFDSSTSVGKATLSLVVMAHASGATVTLGGGNACNVYSSVEDLIYIVTEQ